MRELCDEDPYKKWHAKLADPKATNSAPVGLIAFAGVVVSDAVIYSYSLLIALMI